MALASIGGSAFGDFNCVQSPHLGKLGGLRSGRPESPELKTMLQVLGLKDAQTLATSAMKVEVLVMAALKSD